MAFVKQMDEKPKADIEGRVRTQSLALGVRGLLHMMKYPVIYVSVS